MPLAAPDTLACVLSAEDWSGVAHLGFRPDDPPFAELHAARTVELRIPIDDRAWGVLDADAYAVRVRGHVPAGETTLYPTHAFLAHEVLVMSEWTALTYTRGELGHLLVRFDPDRHVRFLHPLEALRVRCADVGLSHLTFEATSTLDEPLLSIAMELPTGRPIRVAPAPQDTPVAELSFDVDERAPVTVVAMDGPMAEVLWTGGAPAVLGWVPRVDLLPPGLSGQRTRAPRIRTSSTPRSERIVCDSEITLYAEVDKERRNVGVVAARSQIMPFPVAGAYTPLTLPDATATPAANAAWLVLTEDLATCKRTSL
jgi:hypothetical protein